jgi:hypothetical protein
VTTGNYADVNQREEMVRRDLDSISFQFIEAFSPFIGITNVTPSNQNQISLLTDSLIDQLSGSSSAPAALGPQMIAGVIVSFGVSPTQPDHYVMVIGCTLPVPFNNEDIYLVVG